MGQKTASINECISCTFSVCIDWSGAVLANPYVAISIPGTWRFKICLFWHKKPHNSTTYNSTPRIIESTEWWHSARTTYPTAASYRIIDCTEWRQFNKTLRLSLVGTTTTIYRMDYIHFSLQQQSINLKCPTTLTTIIRQVPRNYLGVPGTRYQVSRRKEDREWKKINKKIKWKMKQDKRALREQAESWGDKVAVCWWYGQSYDDVSSCWTIEGRQKRPDGG